MIWAFNQANSDKKKELLVQSIRGGKSRFGWSQLDTHNLLLPDNWTDNHSKQIFLLEIQAGDWIVHINTPSYGKCIAGKAAASYQFDEGLLTEDGQDFRHCIPVDPNTVIEFDRNDQNILPSVNLRPRQRYHRIYEEADFLRSIENLRKGAVTLDEGVLRSEVHIKEETNEFLSKVTTSIQRMNRSKDLEIFFAKVIRGIPGVVHVKENGFGWGTDHGADLIVTVRTEFGKLESRIVVQIKSYEGNHEDLKALNQIETAVTQYGADAAILISTAQPTEKLEQKRIELTEKLGVPIDLIAGKDVARFVIKYASNMIFHL
jgi:hypothetical protein